MMTTINNHRPVSLMRELERKQTATNPARERVSLSRVSVVGRGRLGTALASGLRAAGLTVDGPLGRDAEPAGRGSAPRER